MTRKTEALLWVDIETTGTDPRHDLMLEIGLRCTSMDAKNRVRALRVDNQTRHTAHGQELRLRASDA